MGGVGEGGRPQTGCCVLLRARSSPHRGPRPKPENKWPLLSHLIRVSVSYCALGYKGQRKAAHSGSHRKPERELQNPSHRGECLDLPPHRPARAGSWPVQAACSQLPALQDEGPSNPTATIRSQWPGCAHGSPSPSLGPGLTDLFCHSPGTGSRGFLPAGTGKSSSARRMSVVRLSPVEEEGTHKGTTTR